MWTGNVSPVIRQKAKGSRPKRNLERRAARRVVLPGFPIEPYSFTWEEVKAYFAGDVLLCLRCGKKYKKLSAHLHWIHSMSEDAYKKAYGLPWSKGLAGIDTHTLISSIVKERLKNNDYRTMLLENARKGRLKMLAQHTKRRVAPGFKQVCIHNIKKMAHVV